MQLGGIHHLSAVTANANRNFAFYTEVLGLRLIKKTINQDDYTSYHLFYADAVGTPGTALTFFDWPLQTEKRGNHSIIQTGLRVSGEAGLAWWSKRFEKMGVAAQPIDHRDGRARLDFEDFEGQRLCLIDDRGEGDIPQPWERSPVPSEYQIRGLGPITLSISRLEGTDHMLREILNMRRVRDYVSHNNRITYAYAMGPGGPGSELHVQLNPDLALSRHGAGSAHHLALRASSQEQFTAWIERLSQQQVSILGPINRFYFQSLYFREPNGILLEIATDSPGFLVDEPEQSLGSKVCLPPALESQRDEIEHRLKPLEKNRIS